MRVDVCKLSVEMECKSNKKLKKEMTESETLVHGVNVDIKGLYISGISIVGFMPVEPSWDNIAIIQPEKCHSHIWDFHPCLKYGNKFYEMLKLGEEFVSF